MANSIQLPLPGAVLPARAPLRDTDPQLASLPAYDQREYYDIYPPQSLTDMPVEEDLHCQDGIGAFSGLSTNRGNKLHPAARSARRKRMPGWASTLPISAEADAWRPAKRQKFDLTNTLSLIPADSELFDNDNADGPAQADLPSIPTNMAEVLISPFTATTFKQKESMLPTLALSAIGLIEADTPCARALARTCTVLRGDEINWDALASVVPEKFKSINKMPSTSATSHTTNANSANTRAGNTLLSGKPDATDSNAQPNKSLPASEALGQSSVQASGDTNAVTYAATSSDQAPFEKSAHTETSAPVVLAGNQATNGQTDLKEETKGVKEASTNIETAEAAATDSAIQMDIDEAASPKQDIPISRPIANSPHSRSTPPDAPINTVDAAENDADATESEALVDDQPGLRPRNRSKVRAGGYQESQTDEEDEEQRGDADNEEPASENAGVEEEDTPLAAKWKRSLSPESAVNRARLLQPHAFVESLFVTPNSIAMTSPHNPAAGPSYSSSPHFYTPEQQQVLMYASLAELQRLLADAYEYQNRLREISDGVLGVERRRKGLYKIIKLFANDYIEAEAAAASTYQ